MQEDITYENQRLQKLGLIHVYTGEGKGKSTAALGAAMRALGHGLRVAVVHFRVGTMATGEQKMYARLAPLFEYYPFGGETGVDLENWTDEDAVKVQEALNFARELVNRDEARPHVLILEDVNVVTRHGILPMNEIVDFVENKPQNMELILTGRYAPQELIDRAHIVTNMADVKHYADAGAGARRGVEY